MLLRVALLIGLLFAVVQLAVQPAIAQDTSALINQELDKLVQLRVDGALPQVLKAIEDKTGVPIRPEQAVYDALPWGDQTTVSARIENQTLRDALTAITGRLGLTIDVGPEAVIVKPMPALARLGRRSTLQELEALDLLRKTDLNLPTDRPTIQQVLQAIDAKLAKMKSDLSVDFRPGTEVLPESLVTVPRGSTMAEALESLPTDTDATWYPWGKNILVVPKESVVRNQLLKTISIRFNGDDISQVITDLSQSAGVPFKIEPGAIQRMPAEFRAIHLTLDNATIRQALESLSGFTGLGYVVKGDEVYISNQSSDTNASSSSKSNPVIVSVTLSNGMQFFLRENDTPDDIKQYIQHKRAQEFDKLRQLMRDENFQPTTQPTTKPAGNDL